MDTPQSANLQEEAKLEIGLKSLLYAIYAQVFNRKLAQFRTDFPNWATRYTARQRSELSDSTR
jgi:hypothetical protein